MGAGYEVEDIGDPLNMAISERWATRPANFGNAREIRNLFERSIANQANRIAASASLTDDQLVCLTEQDVRAALKHF